MLTLLSRRCTAPPRGSGPGPTAHTCVGRVGQVGRWDGANPRGPPSHLSHPGRGGQPIGEVHREVGVAGTVAAGPEHRPGRIAATSDITSAYRRGIPQLEAGPPLVGNGGAVGRARPLKDPVKDTVQLAVVGERPIERQQRLVQRNLPALDARRGACRPAPRLLHRLATISSLRASRPTRPANTRRRGLPPKGARCSSGCSAAEPLLPAAGAVFPGRSTRRSAQRRCRPCRRGAAWLKVSEDKVPPRPPVWSQSREASSRRARPFRRSAAFINDGNTSP
jgi:hypothetical protein